MCSICPAHQPQRRHRHPRHRHRQHRHPRHRHPRHRHPRHRHPRHQPPRHRHLPSQDPIRTRRAPGFHATTTLLTAQPRPATLDRSVALMATVYNRSRAGGTPVGDVTFWDGATMLGTVTLRHGKAMLKTSSLPVGRDRIQADYAGNQDFAASSRTLIENVRAPRSRSKAAIDLRADRSRQERVQEQALRTSPIGLSISGGPANAIASQLALAQGTRGLAGDPIRPERKRP